MSKEHINDKELSILNEYFNHKKNYTDFLYLYSVNRLNDPNVKDKYKYTIKDLVKDSNYPLQFREENDSYIIEVLDITTPYKVLARKTYYTVPHINLNTHINHLLSLIHEKDIIENKNMLEFELEKWNLIMDKIRVFDNKGITDDVLKDIELYFNSYTNDPYKKENIIEDMNNIYEHIQEKYNEMRNNNNKILNELNICLELLHNKIKERIELYNSLNLDKYFGELHLYNNEVPLDKIQEKTQLELYNIQLKQFLYQKYSIPLQSGKKQKELCNIGNIDNHKNIALALHKDDFIFMKRPYIAKEVISDYKQPISIVTGTNLYKIDNNGDISTKAMNLKGEINQYMGIITHLKNIKLNDEFYVKLDDINTRLNKVYGYTIKSDIPVSLYKTENIENKNSYYSDKITYSSYFESKQIDRVIKYNVKSPTLSLKSLSPIIEHVSIQEPTYSIKDYINEKENTILYITGDDIETRVYPGKAIYENIEDKIVKSRKYDGLFNLSNWRRYLSNDIVFYKDTGEPELLEIDNEKFATVSHYLLYSMFKDNPDIDGVELEQYNDFSKRFVYNRLDESNICIDVESANDLVKKSGLNIRSDYYDISKYTKPYTFVEERMLKAMIIKYSKIPRLNEILKATEDAKLIMKDDDGKLKYAYFLMKTRNAIQKGVHTIETIDKKFEVSTDELYDLCEKHMNQDKDHKKDLKDNSSKKDLKDIPLFPLKEGIDLSQVVLTEEGKYSYTKRRDGEQTIDFLKKHLGGNLSNYTILDGTANVGADTILFAMNFKYVDAIEYDKSNYNALKHNVALYNLSNVKLHFGDTTKLYDKFCPDIIYFDPPWGGPDYKYKKNLDLYLGDIRIDTFVRDYILATNRKCYPQYIILKLPFNYSWSRLKNLPYIDSFASTSIRNYNIVIFKIKTS